MAPMAFPIDELKALSILEGLPDGPLAWLAENGTRIELESGARMFNRGQPADFMFIVVSGTIERHEEIGGQWLVVATTTAGHVTGMLPYSRMTQYPGHAVAAEPSRVLRIAKSDFDPMLAASHELGQRLVAEMSDRVRGDVRLEQQQDKMMALGRLSAGLAHELNNPAAAIRRTVATLGEQIAAQRSLLESLSAEKLDQAVFGRVKQLVAVAAEPAGPALSTIEQSEREDEIAQLLEEHSMTDAWDAAAILATTGLSAEQLESFLEAVPAQLTPKVVTWMVGGIEVDRMVSEITSAADRISDLVSAVKTYSHMDRSNEHKPIDIRDGLDNTLTILRHRLKEKEIQLHRHYPDNLPAIPGHAGELNQLWTNLIDNAIDAVDHGGDLTIEAEHDEWGILVRIVDNGSGIPQEIQHRIFDPFFTTKDVSEGTGLGLDIARRIVRTHRGQIEVHSNPGHTEFRVRLPNATGAERDSPPTESRR